jgi:hypothetical protein
VTVAVAKYVEIAIIAGRDQSYADRWEIDSTIGGEKIYVVPMQMVQHPCQSIGLRFEGCRGTHCISQVAFWFTLMGWPCMEASPP